MQPLNIKFVGAIAMIFKAFECLSFIVYVRVCVCVSVGCAAGSLFVSVKQLIIIGPKNPFF